MDKLTLYESHVYWSNSLAKSEYPSVVLFPVGAIKHNMEGNHDWEKGGLTWGTFPSVERNY